MLALSLRQIASHSETIQRHPALSQRDTMASGKARMPYGTIIFIALILVVACSLLYWLSALCGHYLHPKRDGKALTAIRS